MADPLAKPRVKVTKLAEKRAIVDNGGSQPTNIFILPLAAAVMPARYPTPTPSLPPGGLDGVLEGNNLLLPKTISLCLSLHFHSSICWYDRYGQSSCRCNRQVMKGRRGRALATLHRSEDLIAGDSISKVVCGAT